MFLKRRLKEIVVEIGRREAGNEFQLYGTDNVKTREHVEWVLLRWGYQGVPSVFDDLVIVLLQW